LIKQTQVQRLVKAQFWRRSKKH